MPRLRSETVIAWWRRQREARAWHEFYEENRRIIRRLERQARPWAGFEPGALWCVADPEDIYLLNVRSPFTNVERGAP